ncbi:HRDC domain-containing protein [Bifidobacterium sp. LC6]|uniref:HRDC domain-containing protein n=1 Tax=Bifidobacterium colobi TaxID=2809026 RepID=A0ABS5UWE2_9BIFI|nr:HRDC domain-containing protein [Bifidobacterium colobi]
MSDMRDTQPRLLKEPRGGVPNVTATLDEYHRVCESLAAASGSLAADAERASGFRYGHEDWLIQFKREGAGIVLLDPIALTEAGADWAEFNDAVGEATWILHDSLMDLPGFADIGLSPKHLFDTEIAARLLGLHRFGLASVTEHYLGITLAKEHSAADWSYRPLPRDWRNYAALDVEVLIELEDAMRRDLKAAGKDEWAEEEFDYALSKGLAPRKPHPVPWLRISRITELGRDPQGLAVAKSLWEERDRLAKHYDISPSLLLADSSIIEAAQRKPHNAAQFRMVRSLNERVRMHTGTEQDKMFERYAPIQRMVKPKVWKLAIDRALALKPEQWPSIPAPEQPDENGVTNAPRSMRLWQQRHPERYERLQHVRKVINQIAEDTRTPAEIIIKPQIIRNLCWVEDITDLDVAGFLAQQGARNWQVRLIAPSVSGVIM